MGYADHRQITILQGLPTRNCNPKSTKSSPKTKSWTLPPQNEEERHLQITRTLGFKLLVFCVRPQPGLEISSVDQDAILMLEDLICHAKQLNFVGGLSLNAVKDHQVYVHEFSSIPQISFESLTSDYRLRYDSLIHGTFHPSDHLMKAPCLLLIPHAEQPAERRSATNRDLWMSWASRKRTWFFSHTIDDEFKFYTCKYLLKTFDYRHQAVL